MSLIDALLLEPYFPLDYYLADREDGVGGTGTLNDPWNASTADRFDQIMRDKIPPFAHIHIGPGAFSTKGYYDGAASDYGWRVKPGWKITGAGIDATKLQLVGATASDVHYFAVGHALASGAAPNPVDFCEISGLTIDCALGDSESDNTGVSAFGAVRLMGNYVKISGVKAVNWGTTTSSKPCFVLSLITADRSEGLVEFVNGGISDCFVVEPSASTSNVGPSTALHAGVQDQDSPDEANGLAFYIRNCVVDCGSPTATAENRGFSMSWCRGGVIESNQLQNTKFGVYLEGASLSELILRGNVFKNCLKGVFMNMGGVSSDLITSGAGILSTSGGVATVTLPSPHNLAVGDRVKITVEASGFDGIHEIADVESMKFSFSTSGTASSLAVTSLVKIFGVDHLFAEGNLIQLAKETTGDLIGIHIHDSELTGQDAAYPAFVNGKVVLRKNDIRYVVGTTGADGDFVGYGIQVNGAKAVIIDSNVVEVLPPNPIQDLRCGAVEYFHNQTPAGALIQGYNGETETKYSELETEAEDALLMALT